MALPPSKQWGGGAVVLGNTTAGEVDKGLLNEMLQGKLPRK
jgi:hypothetical protein